MRRFYLLTGSLVFLALFTLQTTKTIGYGTTLSVTVSGTPHCSDGVDNDSDGSVDYPGDTGCSSALDENEIDPAPSCGDNSCNGSESCNTCSQDCGSCSVSGGGGGGGGGTSSSLNTVIFKGVAYPGSKVTILRDGNLAASVSAGPDAKFEMRISDLLAGTYVFGTWAQDSANRKSSIYTFTVSVSQGITTTVSGIFVSPTIATDKIEVKRGDVINIFGQAAPNATMNIIINSESEITKSVKTDALGSWLYKFNSLEVESGEHTAKSRIILDDDVSPDSRSAAFKVGTKNVAAVDQNMPSKGDINGDGKVSMVDFSIMAYWFKRPSPRSDIDLNKDGKVNLTDFSILAYYWTG